MHTNVRMPVNSLGPQSFGSRELTYSAGKHSLKRGIFYAIEKFLYHRTVKSLSAGRSCGKIDASVFEQFSNLSGLSLGLNQLEIINKR